MAYENRCPQFDLAGYLASAISETTTAITAKGDAFTGLRTDLSTGLYIPLTIADDNLGISETVWATSHAAASPTVGVIRGREGTTPRKFDPGVIIRCGPTIRDVTGAWANRAALPSDPHLGMRALLLDEQLVLERTSTGWNDSAMLKNDPARKHHWVQTGANLAAGTAATLSGLSGSQSGTAGTIGTMNAGAFLPNKAGDWYFALALYIGNIGVRNQGLEMNWPGSGQFMGASDNLYDYHGVNSGSNGLTLLQWGPTYVTPANAAKPITLRAFSSIAATNCQYDFYAEYRGA